MIRRGFIAVLAISHLVPVLSQLVEAEASEGARATVQVCGRGVMHVSLSLLSASPAPGSTE